MSDKIEHTPNLTDLMCDDLLKIKVNQANAEYCGKQGSLNGTLLADIRNIIHRHLASAPDLKRENEELKAINTQYTDALESIAKERIDLQQFVEFVKNRKAKDQLIKELTTALEKILSLTRNVDDPAFRAVHKLAFEATK